VFLSIYHDFRDIMINKIKEASQFIKNEFPSEIQSAIILGSGMGGFEKTFTPLKSFDYSEIPHFIKPSVEGHSGTLTFVEIKDKVTAILSGRAHYYEGYNIQDIVLPTRVLSDLNIKNLVITNAAGGVNSNYSPGDIVAIKDHINLTGDNPLIGKNIDEFGPRFPDMSEVYNLKFRKIAETVSSDFFDYKEGVYAWFTGPTYETPSEVNFAKTIGADLVGMSTVPEAIVARHAGIDVTAFSLVTNLAAGISEHPLSHDEVIEIADKTSKTFQSFMKRFLEQINLSI